MLAQKDYKRRHDKVCSHLYLRLSRKYGLDVDIDRKWYHHKPENVDGVVKILWNYNIQTDRSLNIVGHKKMPNCSCSHTIRPKYPKKEFEKINIRN